MSKNILWVFTFQKNKSNVLHGAFHNMVFLFVSVQEKHREDKTREKKSNKTYIYIYIVITKYNYVIGDIGKVGDIMMK